MTLLACAWFLPALLLAGQVGASLPADDFLLLATEHTGCQSVQLVLADSLRLARCTPESGAPCYFALSTDFTAVQGYNGVTALGIVYGEQGEVRQVRILSSEDTRSFVRRLRHGSFLGQFAGYSGQQPLSTVTGATITSRAVNKTVQEVTEQVQGVLTGGELPLRR